MNVFRMSIRYGFVRARQLEGTFPGDKATGTWPITGERISYGWGNPPEESWPYSSDWPPEEPPDIDLIATKYRFYWPYRRVRTIEECKSSRVPVGVSLETTDKWANPWHGHIPAPSASDIIVPTMHYVAAIVCFNSPFDLSRISLKSRPAKLKNTGWSVTPWPDEADPFKPKPWIRIKPKDSRSAFMSFVGGDPSMRLNYGGRFLDLSVLGWALRNKHKDLNGFLESFGLKPKADHEPTGRVTQAELRYGRTDTKRTVELLNAMKDEYDGFPLELRPEEAMSAASITKAFLDEMRITPPAKKFKLAGRILGKCMQAYYGGRSEIRVRHQEMPVVVCDTTSEYPSVAALLQLWPLLTASKLKVVKCTREARATLARTTLKGLLSPTSWRELGFFASVKPHGDILPVRSLYNDTGNTNIGLNPLTSTKAIWYSGPDLATSKLQTGHTPKVIKAFKLVPLGTQRGMRNTRIGARNIDPETDDFFRAIIEERKSLPNTHPHYLLLKIIANSLYGIFAELNKYEYGKNNAQQLSVFSGEIKFTQPTRVVER
jgi:hypothetical protein